MLNIQAENFKDYFYKLTWKDDHIFGVAIFNIFYRMTHNLVDYSSGPLTFQLVAVFGQVEIWG